jgi:hypothetical protein
LVTQPPDEQEGGRNRQGPPNTPPPDFHRIRPDISFAGRVLATEVVGNAPSHPRQRGRAERFAIARGTF